MPEFQLVPEHIASCNNARRILWHIQHNDYSIPVCKNCNITPTKWDHTAKTYRQYCSIKCSATSDSVKKKTQRTQLKKYNGHSSADAAVQKKRQQSLENRFGKNHAEVIAAKRTATMMERYGCEYTFQNETLRTKAQQTIKQRYGCDHAMQHDDVKRQHKQSMLQNHGVVASLQSKDLAGKIKNTMKARYGVEHAMQSHSLQQKAADTNTQRYGTPWYNQKHFTPQAMQVLTDPDELSGQLKHKNRTTLSRWLEVDATTVSNYVNRHGLWVPSCKTSNFEHELSQMLDDLGVSATKNSRSVIPPLELDFYLPEHNLAIECNGDYWHSHKFKHRLYHYEKWRAAKNENINLIQISECDFANHKEKFRNIIAFQLGMQPKGAPARKTHVQQISSRCARPFVEKHHLQGFVGGTHFGAYYGDELIAVMTIGWTRGTKHSRRRELKRWITDGHSHAGLFSKVFAHSVKAMHLDEVVSFSMNDWFTGDVYARAGFECRGITPPGYRYNYCNKMHHASAFTKANIKKKIPHVAHLVDSGHTEFEIMDQVGALRVWNSGKTEWVWRK